jgi:hypothetical protein
MHRLTYTRTIKLSVRMDINDEAAARFQIAPEAIDRYLDNRQEEIIQVASAAAGAKIIELLQAYAEEFVAADGTPLPPAPPLPPPPDADA